MKYINRLAKLYIYDHDLQISFSWLQVIVNYTSGNKSAFLWSELHTSICKGLLKGNNCTKTCTLTRCLPTQLGDGKLERGWG